MKVTISSTLFYCKILVISCLCFFVYKKALIQQEIIMHRCPYISCKHASIFT